MIVCSAAAFPFAWPKEVQAIIDFQKQVASIGANLISIDCLASDSGTDLSLFFLKNATYAAMPFVFMAFALLLNAMWALFSRYHLKQEVNYQEKYANFITGIVVFVFFLQPSIIQQTFLMFSCLKLGTDNSDYFLVDDMHIRCYTPDHVIWLLNLGMPMMIIYVIGVPIISFWLLYVLSSIFCVKNMISRESST